MSKYPPWTPIQIEVLRYNWCTLGKHPDELCTLLGRNEAAIRSKARNLNLERPPHYKDRPTGAACRKSTKTSATHEKPNTITHIWVAKGKRLEVRKETTPEEQALIDEHLSLHGVTICETKHVGPSSPQILTRTR